MQQNFSVERAAPVLLFLIHKTPAYVLSTKLGYSKMFRVSPNFIEKNEGLLR
jgi:hypothetical protein